MRREGSKKNDIKALNVSLTINCLLRTLLQKQLIGKVRQIKFGSLFVNDTARKQIQTEDCHFWNLLGTRTVSSTFVLTGRSGIYIQMSNELSVKNQFTMQP